ncbi:hypothetical protein EAE96_001544 [Botrytis aclada]|nr:hypothetical protein EAE96_001544 [Botrytis aclada]
MPITKKKKSIRTMDMDDSEDSDDFEARLGCNNSNRLREPIILKPEIMEQTVKGKQVTQRWGLPTPCECKARDNTADVIVSAIELWKPSALLKLLDLNVSQFHWSISTYDMEFCVKRSWRFLRVTLGKRGLSYHIHDDGKWQLLGSERMDREEVCTQEDHHKENWHNFHITNDDRILAGRLSRYLPWNQERLKEFVFECYITTKDGYWIDIDELDPAGGDVTAANQNLAPRQVSLESGSVIEIETVTTRASSTKRTEQTHLQGTKKRKQAAE